MSNIKHTLLMTCNKNKIVTNVVINNLSESNSLKL